MKLRVAGGLLVGLVLFLALGLSAAPQRAKTNEHKGMKRIGGISVPGGLLRFDISWVDQATARYYLGDSANAGVDVFDAENNVYLGRIGGFHGLAAPDDPCAGNQGMGPSGVVVTTNNQLWATDAQGIVRVFDLESAKPPFTDTRPLASISTGAQCRADEIGFDPKDHVILVGDPAEKPPYGTVISSDPPYTVLSKIPFPDGRGFEQPLWDPDLKGGRMLVTVPVSNGVGKIAVIDLHNPKAPVVETTHETPNCASGLALGPSQHLLVGCGGGKPLIIVNALTGKIITTVDGTRGADEVWYNAGDDRFYAPSGGTEPILSAIDAATGSLSTLPAGPGVHSVAAYRGNNHIFVPIAPPTQAGATDMCNVILGLPSKQGCIAVYANEK